MVERIVLTEEEDRHCREIALKRHHLNEARGYQAHRKFDGYTDAQIHVIGIVGEYVVRRATGVGGFDSFDFNGPDKRGDILLPNGEWVEVKTGRKPRYNFLIEEPDWERLFLAEYGALVWKMRAPGHYSCVGWCSRSEFAQFKEWGLHLPKPCWLLPWERFHPIDELKKRWIPVQQTLW